MKIPAHVAIIMDGNGRWAKKRGLPRAFGHRAGMKALTRIVEASSEIGIKYLTVYSFSTENWNRPRAEIAALMGLLREYIRKEGRRLAENNVKVNILGDVSALPVSAQKAVAGIVGQTSGNSGLVFNIALNYGSRAEIIRAVNSLIASGATTADEKNFRKHLYTEDIPDPDLLIRTSGEMRVSNFLLFQIAYSEIYVTDILWPDFDKSGLMLAIEEYSRRDRRYGGV